MWNIGILCRVLYSSQSKADDNLKGRTLVKRPVSQERFYIIRIKIFHDPFNERLIVGIYDCLIVIDDATTISVIITIASCVQTIEKTFQKL